MLRRAVLVAVTSTVIAAGRSVEAQQEPAGPLMLGAASGEPGQEVLVPVHATFSRRLFTWFVVFEFDAEKLDYLRYEVTGSAAAHVDPIAVSYRTYPKPGDGAFGVHDVGVFTAATPLVPPGDNVHLGQLRFRIRATAAAGSTAIRLVRNIESTAGGPHYTYAQENNGFSSGVPSALISGSVNVVEPVGPRPVGNLTCRQELDRIQLSFQPTAGYDAIEVARNGVVIASLGGDQGSFQDRPGQLGAHAYTITGIKDADQSLPASCRVQFVSPAASPVVDLTCTDGNLSWANTAGYDAITVFRDGTEVAALAGDATGFADPQPLGAGVALYTVVATQEGFRSPDVHCLNPGIWIMEIGDVQVPVDAELIRVPMYVTNSYTLDNFDCHLEMDHSRLQYLRDRELALQGTMTHPEAEQVFMGIGYLRLPSVGVIFDAFPPPSPEKKLSVGLRQLVYYFNFRPTGVFADGETLHMSVAVGNLGLRDNPAQGIRSLVPRFLSGQIRFGSGGPATVRNLAGTVEQSPAGDGGGGATGRDVQLTWRNSGAYDRLHVERNSVVIAELPGNAEAFEDRQVDAGVFTYKVVSEKNTGKSFPASTLVSTVSPRGAFLRGDANRDRRINIADAVTILNYLFRGGVTLTCEDAADVNDDGLLSLSDGIAVIAYQFLGRGVIPAPGIAYPWFDPTLDSLSCHE